MTTKPHVAHLSPYARPSSAALVGRLLNGAVAVYILSAMLLGAAPGLSRVPHAAVLAMLGLLVLTSTQRPLRLRLDAALVPAALFGTYAVASVLWSTDQSRAFTSAVGLGVDMLGALAVWAALQNGVSLRLVAWASAAAASVQAALALNQHFIEGMSRAEGLTGNANSLAIQLSLAAFLVLLATPRKRWPGLLALFLIVVATLTTGTRKLVFVWFAYLLVLLRDLFPVFRRPSIGLALTVLLSPVAVWASLTYAPLLGVSVAWEEITFVRRVEGTFEGRGTAIRSGMIEDGLAVFAGSPVFGEGIDQYRIVGAFGGYAHNNYVELLANFGVVGFVLFYAIYLVIGFRALRGLLAGHRSAWVVLAILVVYLLMDVARVSYAGRFTWLHLLVLALVTLDRTRPEEERLVEA